MKKILTPQILTRTIPSSLKESSGVNIIEERLNFFPALFTMT